MQSPQPAVAAERARRQGAHQELAQEQGVALGALEAPLGDPSGDRPVEDGGQELGDVGGAERPQLEALGEVVFPEGDDGVRGRFTRPDGGQDEDLIGSRELVGESGGRLVEEMGVVDQERDPPALAQIPHRLTHPAEDPGPVRACHEIGQERAVGAEGQAGRRLRGGHPDGHEAGPGGEVEALARQPGLAHTGRSDEDDVARAGFEECGDVLELGHPTHEGPCTGPDPRPRVRHGSRVSHVPVRPSTAGPPALAGVSGAVMLVGAAAVVQYVIVTKRSPKSGGTHAIV